MVDMLVLPATTRVLGMLAYLFHGDKAFWCANRVVEGEDQRIPGGYVVGV